MGDEGAVKLGEEREDLGGAAAVGEGGAQEERLLLRLRLLLRRRLRVTST